MIISWLNKHFPRKEIGWDNDLYLTRWYLCHAFGRHWVLHRFSRPDRDRQLHTHPWDDAFSVVLWGSYIEQYASNYCALTGPVVRHRKVRWFNRIIGARAHRIESLCRPTVWTLFSFGKKTAKWGFFDKWNGRWVHEPYDATPNAGGHVDQYGKCPLWEGEPL